MDQVTCKHFLQQRGSHGQNTDTGSDVQEKHEPAAPELRRSDSFTGIDVKCGSFNQATMTVVNHVALVDRNITGWFVSRSGNAHGEAAQEHHNGIAACHNGKCLPQADGSRSLEETDQFLCQRSANHSATAETTDSHTRCHTDTVREPFDQCGNRSDVTETKTDTADNCGKPCDPQLMSKGGDSHHEEEETETATGSQTAFAWASMFQPVTEDSRCRTEHEEQNALNTTLHMTTFQSHSVVNN